jgi:ribose transport system ATP-binding protein
MFMALIEAQQISKHFGGVVALDAADFRCEAGEIHALLGENGAGKSTLVKILSGVFPPDTGTLLFAGQPLVLTGPAQAARMGIVPVFQELSLIPDLTVAQNILLGREPRTRWGLIDMAALHERAADLLGEFGFSHIDPQAIARELPLAERQLVEIAKTIAKNPQVLVLDEGTSALGASQVQQVFAILRRLRDQGRAVVYISHRMEEIQSICDSATVFRDGRHVATFPIGARGHDEIVRMMIGRKLVDIFPQRPPHPVAPKPILEVASLSWEHLLKDISFTLHEGEILGLSGLEGQGQGALLFALFGAYAGVHGTVRVGDQPAQIHSPRDAMRAGIGMALVPEDRKTQGLILPMSLRANVTLPTLGADARAGIIRPAAEQARTREMVKRLAIKAASSETPVRQLSGGNQQKVAIAKWLLGNARVLLLHDLTRGIDVGTKQEIYTLMRSLADSGMGLLFFSTDLSEIVNLCDRALVLYEGRIVRELSGADLTESRLVSAALNLTTPTEPAAGD